MNSHMTETCAPDNVTRSEPITLGLMPHEPMLYEPLVIATSATRVLPLSVLPDNAKRRKVRVMDQYVELSEKQWLILDTPHYQSLRHIRQLAVTERVYPSANGTRFEHMLLTSKLATDFMRMLQANQPHVGITDQMIECMGTAALVHDIGHCMFSHLFDYQLVKAFTNVPEYMREHETRGVALFEWMCRHYELSYSADEVKYIQHLITGEYLDGWPRWSFMILNNQQNTLDVDKLSYLHSDRMQLCKPHDLQVEHILAHARIIGDEICYARKLHMLLNHVFETRKINFTQIYRARQLGSIEAIFICIFEHMSKALEWGKMFVNPEVDNHKWRIVMTDAAIHNLPGLVLTPAIFENLQATQQVELNKAYALYRRVEERDWFKLIEPPHLVSLHKDVDYVHIDSPNMSLSSTEKLDGTPATRFSDTCIASKAHFIGPSLKRKRSEKEGEDDCEDAPEHANEIDKEGIGLKRRRRTAITAFDCSSLPPPLSRQVTEPDTMHFEYIIGYSNNPSRNPIDTVTMYSVDEKTQTVRLESLRSVLEQERGTNPCYERHEMRVHRERA